MKIDKRKKYIMVLDVETTNNHMEKGAPNDGLVYDIGYTITDKKGNIYLKRSMVITDTFNNKGLMDTAYYKKKLPIYYKRLKENKMIKQNIFKAKTEIRKVMEYYNIKEVYAYNASFDLTTLNNTIRYFSKSLIRHFFPYGTQVCDIWHIACQVLGTQKTFQMESVRNERGNLLTSAERMYQYMIQDIGFEEEHTGLSDAIIETEILARCFRSHKKINKNINRACWRIPQKVVA